VFVDAKPEFRIPEVSLTSFTSAAGLWLSGMFCSFRLSHVSRIFRSCCSRVWLCIFADT